MTERAIKLCSDNGFNVIADMCLHKHNQHTLRESVNHLASLGAYFVRIGGIHNTESWKENNEAENSLTFEELFTLYYDYLPHFFEDNLPVSLQFGCFFVYNHHNPNEFYIPGYMEHQKPNDCICGCARTNIYITPEGRVLPCMPMAGTIVHDKMPLIQEKGLAECINNSFWLNIVNLRVRDYLAANDECRNCEYQEKCSVGCRADALETYPDNYMGKSPILCTFIKGGWPEKIISLMKKIKPEAECINLKLKG
ncbi:MAG: radical SAM protein [Synergistaceae bacterium]|nr:radical SAM protein [Synergistaceae bacterium]